MSAAASPSPMSTVMWCAIGSRDASHGGAAALTVDVIGEARAARLLSAPVFDPKGVRIRS